MGDFAASFELFQIQVKEQFARIDRQFERIDKQFERIDRQFRMLHRSFRKFRFEIRTLQMTMEGGFSMIALQIGNHNHEIADIKTRLDRLEGGAA
jgi:archaellum component FlaC